MSGPCWPLSTTALTSGLAFDIFSESGERGEDRLNVEGKGEPSNLEPDASKARRDHEIECYDVISVGDLEG